MSQIWKLIASEETWNFYLWPLTCQHRERKFALANCVLPASFLSYFLLFCQKTMYINMNHIRFFYIRVWKETLRNSYRPCFTKWVISAHCMSKLTAREESWLPPTTYINIVSADDSIREGCLSITLRPFEFLLNNLLPWQIRLPVVGLQ